MSKEYHAFTNHQDNHEQAFVFEIERDEENHFIELKELWIVTIQNTGEVKTRILFDNMMEKIVENEGGNLDTEQMESVLSVFNNVLGPEKSKEVREVIENKMVDLKLTKELILASELAKMIHETETDIQSVVDYLLSNKSTNGKNE